ncbi:MAG: DUF1232 domain-containing protein [Myxococcales bacterium]
MPKFTLVHAIRRPNGAAPNKPSSDLPTKQVVDVPPEPEAINENAETARQAEQAESEVEAPARWYARWFDKACRNLGHQHLVKLAQHRGHVAKSLDDVPKRMHRVANQTRLVLELIDDFVEGRYRKISWRSMVVLAGAVLYTVNPADVIPDALPFLGAIDDLALLAVATRLLRKDLERYCRFKHYSVTAYFG